MRKIIAWMLFLKYFFNFQGKIVAITNGKEYLRFQMKKPCEHLFLKPILYSVFNITKDCVILKVLQLIALLDTLIYWLIRHIQKYCYFLHSVTFTKIIGKLALIFVLHIIDLKQFTILNKNLSIQYIEYATDFDDAVLTII